jgi:hypothetical protein
MPADQLNFGLFTYVDDNGVSWNKRGEDNSIINTIDGSSAFGGHPRWPKETRRFHTRKARYVDATTFRSKTVVIYTVAAYAALTTGTSTLALHVPGETATVTYTLAEKIPEKQPGASAVRQLGDHA